MIQFWRAFQHLQQEQSRNKRYKYSPYNWQALLCRMLNYPLSVPFEFEEFITSVQCCRFNRRILRHCLHFLSEWLLNNQTRLTVQTSSCWNRWLLQRMTYSRGLVEIPVLTSGRRSSKTSNWTRLISFIIYPCVLWRNTTHTQPTIMFYCKWLFFPLV